MVEIISSYCYKVTNKKTGHFYIGCKKSNKEIIGINYFTSSKSKNKLAIWFRYSFCKNSETLGDWDIEILFQSDVWKEVLNFESDSILSNGSNYENPLSLNFHNQSKNFDPTNCSGKIWINNGIIEKLVRKKFLKNWSGFSSGRLPLSKEKKMRRRKIKQSEEACRKKSIRSSGHKNPRAQKVVCYDEEYNEYACFFCAEYAADFCGIGSGSIRQSYSKNVSGGNHPYSGKKLYWRKLDSPIVEIRDRKFDTNSGKICINNGIKNKFINPLHLDKHLAQGWATGLKR